MTLKIGVLMDDINTIKPYKDSTFAMMLAAQSRGHELFYFQQNDLVIETGQAYVTRRSVTVKDKTPDYYALGQSESCLLNDFHAILMRKDPPFDMEYIYSTYMLEMAERSGTLIVNPPSALRAVNEKFYINYFPELTPKTLVTRNISKIRQFIAQEGKAVVKPMNGMGGMGIFKVGRDDVNTNAILESLGNGKYTIMVQTYLDKVVDGDKRVLLVDGEPAKYGLARIPQGNEFRANLATGGLGEVQALTERELQLCQYIKPMIKDLGLLFVGLDVIGGYITEINVTSPTCIREIEAETGERIADTLIIAIEKRCA
ncbi:MAG: glutathione synthase [Gammaproteobacteria bacterium]|nr:MAG: glutathione synthase [Gammaproteobacteria bacterium]